MRKILASLWLIGACFGARAQNLTAAQKDSDLRYLASLYSTYYAPADWKKQLFGFDLLDVLRRLLEHALCISLETQHLPCMRGRDAHFERRLQLPDRFEPATLRGPQHIAIDRIATQLVSL